MVQKRADFMSKNKHEFALYFPAFTQQFGSASAGALVTLDNEELCHRILKVLRLQEGEQVTLFNNLHHAQVEIIQTTKRTVGVRIIAIQENTAHKPAVTFLLPLLKRADLEVAIYSLVEMGVTTIQLVATEKTANSLHSEKEFLRLQNIMIAAAEQSKNFSMPELAAPILFTAALAELEKPCIFFDPQGDFLLDVLNPLIQQKPAALTLMVGPEGDLTELEKNLLKQSGAQFCALTPTVLRSVQAVALGAGMIRTVLR
jgi:16S rRNA (uracil1498-N3)-methyltransferase